MTKARSRGALIVGFGILFALAVACWPGAAAAAPSDYFVTIWKTDNAGVSNSTSVEIPVDGSLTYNYDVDWENDGTFDDLGLTGAAVHDYGVAGTYTVAIRGTFPRFVLNNTGDKDKLLDVTQWGTQPWESMASAFYGASNVVLSATDVPDLSGVSNFNSMLRSASAANPDTSAWDMSNATDLSSMFRDAVVANPDTSGWDTSAAINMSSMFSGARLADPDTSGWDTSAVTGMLAMFNGAREANPDTSGWDTSNVTNMSVMFRHAVDADPDTSGWDTSAVTNMSGMFRWNVTATPDTSGWDTSNVTNMSAMFNGASAANPDTSGWDTGSVEIMGSVFSGASAADPDTSGWDTSNVTDMSAMFAQTTVANPDTSGWDTSNVIHMSAMFAEATVADPDTSGWDTSSVINMSGMFRDTGVANPDTSGWETSSVTNMSALFRNAVSASPKVGLWDVTAATTVVLMFDGSALDPAEYDLLLSHWPTQALKLSKTFDVGATTFCNGAVGRNALIGSFGWTVNDGGRACEGFEFVTVWQTDLPGSSSATSISIPVNPAYTYDYDVDWDNDGTYDEFGLTGAAIHDYGSSGTVEVAIRGLYPHFRLASSGDRLKLLEVRDWGSQPWADFSDSLSGAANATVTDTDAPELRLVTSLASSFDGASVSDPDLSGWDVSGATDLSGLLDGVALSPGRYDALLGAWVALPLQPGVTFDAGPNSYCAGTAARSVLTDTFGWTVNDGGPDCQLSVSIDAPTLVVDAPVSDTTITVTDLVGIQPGGVAIDGASTASYHSLACIPDSATQVTCSIEVTSPGALIVAVENTNGHTESAQATYSAPATTTTAPTTSVPTTTVPSTTVPTTTVPTTTVPTTIDSTSAPSTTVSSSTTTTTSLSWSTTARPATTTTRAESDEESGLTADNETSLIDSAGLESDRDRRGSQGRTEADAESQESQEASGELRRNERAPDELAATDGEIGTSASDGVTQFVRQAGAGRMVFLIIGTALCASFVVLVGRRRIRADRA